MHPRPKDALNEMFIPILPTLRNVQQQATKPSPQPLQNQAPGGRKSQPRHQARIAARLVNPITFPPAFFLLLAGFYH
jgi:hypothetical protein